MPFDFTVDALLIGETGSIKLKSASSASIEYLIDWDDLSEAEGVALTGTHYHYRHAGLLCTGFDYEPFAGSAAVDIEEEGCEWKKAKATLRFESLEDEAEEVINENLALTGEMVSLPKKFFKWDNSGGDPIGNDNIQPQKVIPEGNYTIKINGAGSLPKSDLSSLIGTVNDATWRGWAAQQALYLGDETNLVTLSDGSQEWTITHHFAIRPGSGTWNKVWDAEGAAWRTLYPNQYTPATWSF